MTDERAAFEAWISQAPYERRLVRHEDDDVTWPGQYIYYEVQLAWEAWEARAKMGATDGA